jgi:pyrimidine operon attenuation protein / uracil phosphoribosyltransferase
MSDSAISEYIMQSGQLNRALKRLSMQIVEDLKGNKDVFVLGLNTRGYATAQAFTSLLEGSLKIKINCFPLDAHNSDPLSQQISNQIGPNTYVLLVDDVLFSGSTKILRVAVIIDRGHRRFPVQPDFVGLISPTKFKEHVEVEFDTDGAPSKVVLTEL